MGAVVDVLHVGSEDIETIKKQYSDCTVIKQSNHDRTIQRYTVIILNEDETSYYTFLLQKSMATASANFCARIASDPKFAEQMRVMVKELLAQAQSKLPKTMKIG